MSARARLPWMSANIEPGSTDRREFVMRLGMGGILLAAGAFGVRRLNPADRTGHISPVTSADPWEPHVYVRIGEDGIVTILCHRSEMGQGIRTTMPMIIADEMEADWTMCRVEQAPGEEKYGSQHTDGSTRVRDFLVRYREAGATARALLEDAAAKEWGVTVSALAAHNGSVVHRASGRRKTFGALVATARGIPMPTKERVRVKRPDERRYEGKVMTSIDLVPMTTGTAKYGADVTLPGMKVAVIARPPVWGGRVLPVNDAEALKIAGVDRIVPIPASPMPGAFLPLGGVAVIAANTWAAIKGRDALRITWDNGANASYDSSAYKRALQNSVRAPGKAGRTSGNVSRGLAEAAKQVSAEYYMPHLSHAQMEPLVALAHVHDGTVEIWAPTQSPMDARNAVAQYLEVDVKHVTVNVTLLGASSQSGRRAHALAGARFSAASPASACVRRHHTSATTKADGRTDREQGTRSVKADGDYDARRERKNVVEAQAGAEAELSAGLRRRLRLTFAGDFNTSTHRKQSCTHERHGRRDRNGHPERGTQSGGECRRPKRTDIRAVLIVKRHDRADVHTTGRSDMTLEAKIATEGRRTGVVGTIGRDVANRQTAEHAVAVNAHATDVRVRIVRELRIRAKVRARYGEVRESDARLSDGDGGGASSESSDSCKHTNAGHSAPERLVMHGGQ